MLPELWYFFVIFQGNFLNVILKKVLDFSLKKKKMAHFLLWDVVCLDL